MIPYGGRRTQLSQIDQPPMVGDLGDGRVRQVEGRLSLVEQSNRALLEEVVRLQGQFFVFWFFLLFNQTEDQNVLHLDVFDTESLENLYHNCMVLSS